MAILSCTSPTHLEATRRRMGIAISSKKYRAQKEERRSGGRVSGQACGGVPGSKSNHLEQASKVEVSEPSAGMTPSELKRERRAQLKAEVEEEFIEALDILEDEGKAVAASEPSCLESSWNPSRPPLELHEVASMKRERRRGGWRARRDGSEYSNQHCITLPPPSPSSSRRRVRACPPSTVERGGSRGWMRWRRSDGRAYECCG